MSVFVVRLSRSALHRSCRFSYSALGQGNMSLHTSPDLAGLAARIPKGTIDTHMHVVDPIKFPLDAAAKYRPSPHTLSQANAFLGRLGVSRMVIVQPSIYGNDNSCTLDGLRQLGTKQGRAVIQFDPATTPKKRLQEWHDLGVRGVRLNFKSVGASPTRKELAHSLRAYADAVRGFGWPLELYIAVEDVPMLEGLVDGLGVNIIVDHMGHPTAETLSQARSADEVPGFDTLLKLLKGGHTWIKLSAGYRLDEDPGSPLVRSMCTRLLKARPDRCVFATDWPHTRFDGLDVQPFLWQVLDCIAEAAVDPEQVLVTNAAELFDFGP